MSQNRPRKTARPGGESPFALPPDVSFEKLPVAGGFSYVFRHRTLGMLGRILLQERGDGQCQLTCEVAGDPDDPMTAKRKAVFEPLGLEISRRMPSNPAMDPTRGAPPPPAAPTEVIESKRLPCPHCGQWAAMLIFAPLATDAGRFEDVARKMYAEYARLDVPTWIIGPALGDGPLAEVRSERHSSAMDRPADLWKVWPERGPVSGKPRNGANSTVTRATFRCRIRVYLNPIRRLATNLTILCDGPKSYADGATTPIEPPHVGRLNRQGLQTAWTSVAMWCFWTLSAVSS